jgi:hypothetical protein
MMIAQPSPDAGLPEFIAFRARNTSDRRLVAYAILGVLSVTAVLVWRPMAWLLLLNVAACVAAFGLWGIADRELEGRDHARRVAGILSVLRFALAVIGACGLVGVLLVGLGVVLGPFIS